MDRGDDTSSALDAPAAQRSEHAIEDARTVLVQLDQLLDGLRKPFRLGTEHTRRGARDSLAAVCSFLMSFDQVLAENLHVPLLNLMGALAALDENNVEPILKPTKGSGRAPDSPRRAALMACAVIAVRQLQDIGVGRHEAVQMVARTLSRLGVRAGRGSGAITDRTVRGWCERVAQGAGPIATQAALMMEPHWNKTIESKPPVERRKWILAMLSAFASLSGSAAPPPNV
jgi:hypothetical protein